MALSDNKLLERCMHGKTQNNNECLNSVVWKRCPKDIFVGFHTLQMGVCSAIIGFNDGISGVLDVMINYGLTLGSYCEIFCDRKDNKRVKDMNRKSTDNVKHERKKRRAIRKGFGDKDIEKEGDVYGLGICAVGNT